MRHETISPDGASQFPSGDGMSDGPQPAPEPPPIMAPQDIAYPGLLILKVDATDTQRGILRVRQQIPVSGPGPMTLLYPKWMPGYHSPQNPIELFAGLEIKAGDTVIDWRRDPVEVHAFHIDCPDGAKALDLTFQFLSPTTSSQGDVVFTFDMLNLQWGRMLLYPAGHFSRRIQIQASVTLPDPWRLATVLKAVRTEGPTTEFEPVQLDVLVDSPVLAGVVAQEIELDPSADVTMHIFAHEGGHIGVTPEQTDMHRTLLAQACELFGSRHFDRYRFLVALSDELGGGGVEHHRSAEILAPPTYFTEWEHNLTKRDVMAHEFVHSWNGKFRRGKDSWTPSFERPIRNSLMWVYEGQTQYWGHILTARAGLWSVQNALEALAKVAATYDVRPGGRWRTMADTTRDPVIAERDPIPWPSWQRSEDYYSEGQLLWFEVDTLIRERSGDTRSLDDFARAFFGIDDGSMVTRTYDFDDVVRTLDQIVPYDWGSLLRRRLETREVGAPLSGLERGGYRLVYRDYRSDFCKSFDAVSQQVDLRFSIGLMISNDGIVQEVMWDSAAFEAGLTAGSQIKMVNGAEYSEQALGDAIKNTDGPIVLSVRTRSHVHDVGLKYSGGHRFPHLEPIDGARWRLDEIFAPRRILS